MTAKHTPGPWVADDNEGFSPWSIWSRMAPSGHGTPGRKVAVVDDCSGHSDADAQLIAAAPELLEALQAVLRSFPTDRDMRDAGWERAEIDLACRDYEAARAAISKALPNAAAKEAGK